MALTRLAVVMGIFFQTVSRWRKDFARGANKGGRRGPELCACPQTGPIHLTSPPARTRGFFMVVQPLFDRWKRDPHDHPNRIHVLLKNPKAKIRIAEEKESYLKGSGK